jgi:TonB family protein
LKLIARYCLPLVISITFSAVCFAQQSSQWQRYAGNGEEFSALLPEYPTISDITRPEKNHEKPEHGRMYAAYSDGTVYVILSLDNPNRKEALEIFIKEFKEYPVSHGEFNFEREITANGFKGKQYKLALNSVSGIAQFYMTNRHVYIFEVVGEDLTKPSIKQFLTSFTLDGKTEGKDLATVSQSEDVAVVTAPSVSPSANTPNQGVAENYVYTPKDVTRKAILVTRPEPQYTEEARQNQTSGTVVLRAVFSSSGKVTNIRGVGGLPHGLTNKAIIAAKQMKFLPAVKDGKFVSQYIQIEYNFNLY